MSKAYAYFDSYGVLKEFITDPSVREGNIGFNQIAFYIENEPVFTSASYRFARANDNPIEWSDGISVSTTKVDTIIPAIQDYDPKFFQYGKVYKCYTFAIDSTALSVDGPLEIAITMTRAGIALKLGMLLLNVENSSVFNESSITPSLYYMLLDLLENNSVIYTVSAVGSVRASDYPDGSIILSKNNGALYQVKDLEFKPYNFLQLSASSSSGTEQGDIRFLKQSGIIISGNNEIYKIVKIESPSLGVRKITAQSDIKYRGEPVFSDYYHQLVLQQDFENNPTQFNYSFTTTFIAENKVSQLSIPGLLYVTEDLLGTTITTGIKYDSSIPSTGPKSIIIQRKSNGQITVPETPLADSDAVSKKYVDNIKKDALILVDTTEYSSLESFLESEGQEGNIYLYPVDLEDLTKGYYRYIWEDDSWISMGTTEIDLSDYVTSSELSSELADKVDKVSTSQRLYGTAFGGSQTTLKYDTGTTNGLSIVQRDFNGQINVPITPTDNSHSTSKKYVDDNITNIREVAEGKCQTYVLSYEAEAPTSDAEAQLLKKSDGTAFTDLSDFNTYTTNLSLGNGRFNSQNDSISLLAGAYDNGIYLILTDGTVLKPTFPFKKGDIILVIETDVPDRWYSENYAYKLETSKIDLSIVYTNDNDIIPDDISAYDIGSSSYPFRDIYVEKVNLGDWSISDTLSGSNHIFYIEQVSQNTGLKFERDKLYPHTDNYTNLGSSTNRFKNAYLSGNVIANNVLNVIKAEDIASNYILTQDQADVLMNGKPTVILGTYRSRTNAFLVSMPTSGENRRGFCFYNNNLGMYVFNTTTRELNWASSSQQFGYLDSIWGLNGKAIPAYPSSPTAPQYLTYDTDNSLKWTAASGGGTKKYVHLITLQINGYSDNDIVIQYITDVADAFNWTRLVADLVSKNYTSASQYPLVNGSFGFTNSNHKMLLVKGIYALGSGMQVAGTAISVDNSGNLTTTLVNTTIDTVVSDKVIEI